MTWGSTLDVHWLARGALDEAAEKLVMRASAGDRQALITIYRAHFAEVRALAERVLGCPMTAEDVVHEVFEALPRALRRFRGDGSLRSYLLSMTVRTSRTHVRAARRRRAAEARAADTQPSNTHERDLPSAVSERRELARVLARALEQLPHAQREAFVLCELEERSSQEAGEILGEKSGTVRARVFNARRRLRELLAQQAPELESTRAGVDDD